MPATGYHGVKSASHDFPTDRVNHKALCMLKHCIRSTMIDLSPTPTLTVDDAVPSSLRLCQLRDGSREVGGRCRQ